MQGAAIGSLRSTRYLWLTLLACALFAGAFIAFADAQSALRAANNVRLRSLLLTEELRQFSDNLTRMAHSYVVTGDETYAHRYQEILDIRDGRRPRPAHYHDIYWDLVLADDRRPRQNGPAISFLTLMQREYFPAAEFASLENAKAALDALTKIEFEAAMSRKIAHDAYPHRVATAKYRQFQYWIVSGRLMNRGCVIVGRRITTAC